MLCSVFLLYLHDIAVAKWWIRHHVFNRIPSTIQRFVIKARCIIISTTCLLVGVCIIETFHVTINTFSEKPLFTYWEQQDCDYCLHRSRKQYLIMWEMDCKTCIIKANFFLKVCVCVCITFMILSCFCLIAWTFSRLYLHYAFTPLWSLHIYELLHFWCHLSMQTCDSYRISIFQWIHRSPRRITSYCFVCHSASNVAVITGQEEGLYGWIALNYMLNRYDYERIIFIFMASANHSFNTVYSMFIVDCFLNERECCHSFSQPRILQWVKLLMFSVTCHCLSDFRASIIHIIVCSMSAF
jgi:hypothetical protein